MKLVDWARRQGISYKTAWRWVKEHDLHVVEAVAEVGSGLNGKRRLRHPVAD